MKPAVPGKPGERQHADRQRPGQRRARSADARDRLDVVAERGLALARDHDRERGHVHQQVDEQVEDDALDARARSPRRRRRACSRPGRRPTRRACASASPGRSRRCCRSRSRTTASAASAASQSSSAGSSATSKKRSDDRERGRLGRDRHEGGHRSRRALVDVGRPLVERRHRGLEGEAGRGAARCRSAAAGRRAIPWLVDRRARSRAKSVEPVAP